MAETSPGDCKSELSSTPADGEVTGTSESSNIVMKQDHFGTSANSDAKFCKYI